MEKPLSKEYTDEEKSLQWEIIAQRLLAPEPLSRNLPENKSSQYLIYPDDNFLSYWNLLIIILLLYTATVTPYRLILLEPDDLGFIVWDTIVDFTFFADVLINCVTAYFDEEGNLVKKKTLIFKKYAKGWMLLDFISCIPLQLMQENSNYSKVIRIGRIPKLYRLIKLAKLIRLIKIIKSRSQVLKVIGSLFKVEAGIERIIFYLINFFVLIHILSCIWIFIGMNSLFDTWDNWINCSSLSDADYPVIYITGLYWCITTLSTVGYGDIHPCNISERVYATVVMLIGIFVYSLLIGSITNQISNSDSRNSKLTKKLEILDELSQEYNFDREFYRKLSLALESQFMNYNNDLNDITENIPSHLRTQLLILIHQNMIQGNQFFAEKPPYFVAFIAQLLKQIKLEAGDYVYKEEEYAKSMYFIIEGELDMYFTVPGTEHELSFNALYSNYYFGETDILFSENKLRTSGVKTMAKCNLLLLDHMDLEIVLKKFEEESLQILSLANERNIRLKEKKNLALEAYSEKMEFIKKQSLPLENFNKVPRFSELLGESRRTSLKSIMEIEDKIGSVIPGASHSTVGRDSLASLDDDCSLSKPRDGGQLLDMRRQSKMFIEEKGVREEENLKLAKRKITAIEKDIQECLRIIKNITEFFSDISDETQLLRVS